MFFYTILFSVVSTQPFPLDHVSVFRSALLYLIAVFTIYKKTSLTAHNYATVPARVHAFKIYVVPYPFLQQHGRNCFIQFVLTSFQEKHSEMFKIAVQDFLPRTVSQGKYIDSTVVSL